MPYRTIVIPCLFERDTLIANRAPLAPNDLWDIVATPNRSQEDKCRSRPNRSLSNVNYPANRSSTLQSRRSGEGWMLTSHKVLKINARWTSVIGIKRPPLVVPAAIERHAAACRSASGCNE